MKLLILAIFIACISVSIGEKARYDNYRVYSVEIKNEKQLKVLQDLENVHDGLSFMHSPTSVSRRVDILVPPHKFPLRAVKVSHRPGNPTILIQSTIHAREWVAGATAAYLLNQLLTSRNVEIRELAEKFDWVIVLVANPDGYEYTHKTSYLGAGASHDPCSDTFAGPKGFSEPETLALSKFIERFGNIKLFLTLHSYGQLLMFPYAFTKEHAVNHNDLYQISQATVEAIRKRYKTEYLTGSIAETIYYSSGGETDWMYAVRNVSLAYAVEFRDKGRFGFLLPPNQIAPNSLEFIDGLKAMVKEARILHYF